MGLNSKAALDAVNRPLPPADDLLEAVAMRIVRYAVGPDAAEPWDKSFHDLCEDGQRAAYAVAAEVLEMLGSATRRSPAYVTAMPPLGVASTPVRLDDIDGTPRFVGHLYALIPGPTPKAVLYDGQIYVDTGNVHGSGSVPTRHIYRRSTPAVVAASQAMGARPS